METNVVRLENWSVVCRLWPLSRGAAILPPLQLEGHAYGHGKFIDGTPVVTSYLVSVEGKTVQTHNTTYFLGEMNPEYQAFLNENYPGWDPNNPVHVERHP